MSNSKIKKKVPSSKKIKQRHTIDLKTKNRNSTSIEKVKKFVREKFKKKSLSNSVNANAENNIDLESHKKENKISRDIEISFFYTNDKFINLFEDNDIIADILKKYPTFLFTKTDTETKKVIISLIEDKLFVTQILEYYNITIFDFFKLIFRSEMTVFKGAFLNKVSKIVNDLGYIEDSKH